MMAEMKMKSSDHRSPTHPSTVQNLTPPPMPGGGIIFFLIGLLTFAVAISAAQISTATQSTSAQTQKGAISGVIVKAGTNEPIRKALVTLQPNGRGAQGTANAFTLPTAAVTTNGTAAGQVPQNGQAAQQGQQNQQQRGQGQIGRAHV